jgi:DMSO/TMAO reductase YedYZ molybdopterin-dependent catalytic subunit
MDADLVHPDTRRTDDRVPPGQKKVAGWPILTAGPTPSVDLRRWRFRVSGLVERPLELTWDEFRALPSKTLRCDMHCVTTWSRLDNIFRGVPHSVLLDRAGVKAGARFVLVAGDPDYSTNLPFDDFARPDTMFAYEFDGKALSAPHGGPVRDLIPHLYLWKSAKWATGFEVMAEDRAGFWEERGYHMRGDPWREERHRDDPAWTGAGRF